MAGAYLNKPLARQAQVAPACPTDQVQPGVWQPHRQICKGGIGSCNRASAAVGCNPHPALAWKMCWPQLCLVWGALHRGMGSGWGCIWVLQGILQSPLHLGAAGPFAKPPALRSHALCKGGPKVPLTWPCVAWGFWRRPALFMGPSLGAPTGYGTCKSRASQTPVGPGLRTRHRSRPHPPFF